MPGEGFEPSHSYERGILSPHRLPVPTSRQKWIFILKIKAAVGIEPTNRGFADLCLATWLRRRKFSLEHKAALYDHAALLFFNAAIAAPTISSGSLILPQPEEPHARRPLSGPTK